MRELKRQLSLKDGIFLAFGSVIGSGILFLPSLTFSISGSDTRWVWVITTILCIPLVYIFSDMIKEIPNERGLQGFISTGLGRHVGATIPIIFLGTVSLGMPSSALIVGEYVKSYVGGGIAVKILTAFFIVFGGIFTNLFGIKVNSSIQLAITFLLLALSLFILSLAPPTHFFQNTSFSSKSLTLILPSIIVSFWAFAGFENLTFMAGEFKNPSRDIKISMLFALFLCGGLYLLLSESCASNIPYSEINPLAGLYQLSETISPKAVSTFVITVFAFLAVQINFNSWIWGMSRLVYVSAKQNILPSYFSLLNDKHIPQRSICLLASLFSIVLLVLIIFPSILKAILMVVSTNFVFIYILCLASYIMYKKWCFLKMISAGLLLLFILLFFSSKWLILYPLFLFGLGVAIGLLQQHLNNS